MDPKKAEQIRQQIDSVVGPLNLYALACYAKLLKDCGVRRLQVQRIFLLP